MVEGKPKIAQPALRRKIREKIYALILDMHEQKNISIGFLCGLAKISRASYYKWLHRRGNKSRREKADEEILAQIREIARTNNNLFGYRKMTYALNGSTQGRKYNRKRIRRIMVVNGIRSAYRRKKPHSIWKKSSPAEVKENLLSRNFTASAPNTKWCQDVMEVHYGDGKCYVSTIFDLYDRFPVGVTVSKRNDTKLTDDTYYMAMTLNEGAKPLLHSDRGFQYTRKAYAQMLEEAGIMQSMSRAGRCIDNGPMESFQGTIKDMMKILYGTAHSYEEVVKAVYKTYEYYIYEYPQARFHGKTAYQVRMEALASANPAPYPIARNPRIEKYWRHLEELKTIAVNV